MRLLDYADELAAIDDLLAEVGDVTPDVIDEVERWLDTANADFAAKADDYCAMIAAMEARAKLRADEAKRLSGRASVDRGSASWLKSKLREAMQAAGIAKLETERYRLSVGEAGGKLAVEIDDGAEIPADWLYFEPRPDKDKIREALESGASLGFARLRERATVLRIR